MTELKKQIETFLSELEVTHLKLLWVKHLIACGIDEKEARVWAAEIGHVIDEYRSTLMRLADLMQESNVERIPILIHSWAVGISEVTTDEIQEPMLYLEKQLEKYLPPEEDDPS